MQLNTFKNRLCATQNMINVHAATFIGIEPINLLYCPKIIRKSVSHLTNVFVSRSRSKYYKMCKPYLKKQSRLSAHVHSEEVTERSGQPIKTNSNFSCRARLSHIITILSVFVYISLQEGSVLRHGGLHPGITDVSPLCWSIYGF